MSKEIELDAKFLMAYLDSNKDRIESNIRSIFNDFFVDLSYKPSLKNEIFLHFADRLSTESHPSHLETSILSYLLTHLVASCAEFNQKDDIQLLETNASLISLKYSPLIKLIIAKYINTGSFQLQDVDDVYQEVQSRFLRRVVPKLSGYKGDSLFRTYLSRIIQNLVKEVYRSFNTKEVTIEIDAESSSFKEANLLKTNAFIFNDASGWAYYQYCDAVFESNLRQIKNLYDQKEKLFCLQLAYKVNIKISHILDFQIGCSKSIGLNFLTRIGIEIDTEGGNDLSYLQLNASELFDLVAEFVSIFRKKQVSGSSLQRSFNGWKKEFLINLLTELGPVYAYKFDMESFLHFKYSN